MSYIRGYLIARDIQVALVAIIILLFTVFIFYETSPTTTTSDIILTEKAKQHILYGDSKGGGHIYGANIPCKSEFPESWDSQKIIETVKRQAANDNLDWEKQSNGYYVSENTHENIKTRVVLGRNQEYIITAYPTNQPRNPCNIK